MVFYFEGEILTDKQYFEKVYIKILKRRIEQLEKNRERLLEERDRV